MSDASWPGRIHVADPFPEPPPPWPRFPELVQAVADVWAGRADPREVAARVAPVGADAPLQAVDAPPPEGPWIALESDLVRITTEMDPAAGAACPDLVLGPAADLADRLALTTSVALGAFFVGDGVDATPAHRWAREKPRPSLDERAAVRAIAKAPLAPYRLVALEPGRCELEPLLDLGPAAPTQPVRLRPVAAPLGPPAVGSLLFARVARDPSGWEATCPVAVPLPTLPAATPAWIRWLGWSDRLHRPGGTLTLSMLLARRGHGLLRRVMEHAWVQ